MSIADVQVSDGACVRRLRVSQRHTDRGQVVGKMPYHSQKLLC